MHNITSALPTESKLLWNGESVEFDKAGASGIAILSNGVAVTELANAKKQYYFTWAGGLSEGHKSSGKMTFAQEGKQPEGTRLNKSHIHRMLFSYYRYLFISRNRSLYQKIGKHHGTSGWEVYRVPHGKRIRSLRDSCIQKSLLQHKIIG